ncbi:hypothetical protein Hypma_001586 [Hypsizygus marmoreus]|uniref:Uncharacterized protein n=1 Tax=Hypsizygus marmoreus TaxID=39966 RepID=A0A369J7U2_HYPMA|nr:hypothetical protein Hypma_001586 [Hypsizygus marmoreus]
MDDAYGCLEVLLPLRSLSNHKPHGTRAPTSYSS